jgi:phenylalanyl-tRNA synthetase beta subunit
MKVLYSQLKKYLPQLTATPKEVADVFTMIGFMLDGEVKEVEYQGTKDYWMDLEVRQNRADLLGVQGLARELSAYYDIPLEIPIYDLSKHQTRNTNHESFIEVRANKAVKRVMSVKIDNLEISESPAWLKEYLALYEINSINNLVDLTNYVMLETAHASHAFDVDLMEIKQLIWEIDPSKYKKIKTLDGTEVDLIDEALVISDGKTPLSLSIIGGKDVAINSNTKNIILEMAIYDGGLIRRNSRKMKIITEASSRLEKFLDPESISRAFEMLVSLLLENCGGEISSEVVDLYLQKSERNEISVDLDKVQQIAGMDIAYDESKTYIKRLGFEIINEELNSVLVKRPVNRLDIEQEEDVFEEVIRLKGFYNIPKDKLQLQIAKDVTPSHLSLIDQITEQMRANGFDEVRSWVLVDGEKNKTANFHNYEVIQVVNSINDEVPFLRQTISVSLIDQLKTLKKNFISDVKIFEIGKVFHKKDNMFDENYAVAILDEDSHLNNLKNSVQNLLGSIGYGDILFESTQTAPKSAHPANCYDISVFDDESQKFVKVGIIYLSNKFEIGEEVSIAELNINKLDELKNTSHSTQEIEQKIVSLDQNIELMKGEKIEERILEFLNKINENLWSYEVIDSVENEDNVKYTVRISYMHLSNQEAKDLHKRIFG